MKGQGDAALLFHLQPGGSADMQHDLTRQQL